MAMRVRLGGGAGAKPVQKPSLMRSIGRQAARGAGAAGRGLGAAWANKPVRYSGIVGGGLYGLGQLLGDNVEKATEQGAAPQAGTAAQQAERLQETRNVFGGR